MLVFCGVLCLLPDKYQNITSQFPREKVRIERVDNSMLDAVGIAYNGVQPCEVTILTGAHKGEVSTSYNYLNSALDKDKLFEVGDTAWAMLQDANGALTVTLIDHYRTDTLGWALAALAAALILFGGVIGCGTMVSLAASAVIVWKLLIPLLLEGVNPMFASFVTVVVLTLIIDVLVAGLTRKCLIAVLGSLAGTLVTCVCAVALTNILKLDGGDLPYVVPLLAQSSMGVDTRSLYIGMVFLANSGALMDLSIDIAVALEEIHFHRPDLSRRAMLKSGMAVGRGVLGTMTTTLMLAYSGQLSLDADVLSWGRARRAGHREFKVCGEPVAQHRGRQLWPRRLRAADGADCERAVLPPRRGQARPSARRRGSARLSAFAAA